LAVEVLTALGERDAMIAATEQRAGAALQAMIIDEHLTVSEAAQWCAGAISHREAARLRQLAGPAENRPVNHSTLTADWSRWRVVQATQHPAQPRYRAASHLPRQLLPPSARALHRFRQSR
jgi:hypothetical protein